MAGKHTFSIKGVAEIQFQNAEQEVKKLNTQLAKLGLSDSVQKDIDSLFSNMQSKLENFQKINTSGLTSPEDMRALNRAAEEYTKALDEVVDRVKKISTTEINLGPSKNLETISNLKGQLDSFKTRAEETARAAVTMFDVFKKSTGLSNQAIGFSAKDFEEAAAAGENMDAKMEALQKAALNRIATESAAYKAERKAQADATNELEAAVEKLNQKTAEYGETPNRGQASWLTRYKKAVDEMKAAKEEADKALVDKVAKDPKYQEALDQLTNMKSVLQSIEAEANNMDLGNGLKGGLQDVLNMIARLDQEDLDNLNSALNTTKNTAKGAEEATKGLVGEVDNVNDSYKKTTETIRDLENLQNTLTNFFSLTNTWNLVKSAASNAWATVKELDAAMTEIAVVTDMSLKQVWSMRDEYSGLATDMGAATIDMVNASKLYYQQGLSQAEVTTAATETIKMARIASLDGATATNLMTAAVRGFNMEMSDAAMINDTYSWLAAKSAADTHEIADAMTRTASIAHAAGASFQNTSAFLTQMIETTREAPENLGTALKTIIARFTEMKKAPDEVGLIDGEVVDANKLETSLRKVGIALRDNVTGEFRDFDKVIMDISAKWDTMSQLQQRYVATTAAGSRQQSRFIALVQNHQRLVELSEGAANSAGAATEQFNKTMDSLDSKVNKLQNAMKLFWTNLLDSTVIKGAVDLVTGIVESFNRLIDILPEGASSIGALAVSFASLRAARSVIDGIFKAMGGDGIKKVRDASGGFKELFSTILTGSKGVTKEVLETKEAVEKSVKASGVGTKAIIKNLADQIKYRRLAKASTGEVAAEYTKAAATAGTAMKAQIAMMGKVILIAGAVVAAVALIHAIWKHFDTKYKRTTYEHQLESLKESAKQAAETAEETKAAYDELLGGISEYSEARESLDDLTEGTKEWQDQLVKTNDTVLELIANVPTLAAGLRIGSDGSLIIEPSYMDSEVGKREKAARLSGISAATYDLEVFEKTQEGINRGFVQAFIDSFPDGADYAEPIKDYLTANASSPRVAEMILQDVLDSQESLLSNEERMSAIWAKWTGNEALDPSNPNNFNPEIAFKGQEGAWPEEMAKSFAALMGATAEYQTGLDQYSEALEGYSNQIALASLNPELQNTKAGGVLAQILASTQDAPSLDSDAAFLESAADIRRYMFDNGFDFESIDANRYGVMDEKSVLANLQKIYATIAKSSVDDIPEKIKDDADALRAAIQTLPDSLKFDETSQKLQDAFLGLNEKAQESFASLMNPEEWVVGNELEEGKAKLRQIFNAENDAELEEKMQMSIDDISKYLTELASETEDAFSKMVENSKLLLGKTGSKQLEELVRGSGIDSQTSNLFGRQIQAFAFKNGSDAAETLMTNLTKTINNSSVSKDAAKSITKAFAEADISTPEGLDEFAFLLKEIAPSIPEHETDDFIEQLKLLGNVIEDVDVEGLREKFQKNLDIANRLNVDDPSPEFSKDDVTTIREALMGTSQEGMLKDFIKNADGSYTFIGESIDGLKDAIIENSEGYVKAVSDGFQRQIDLGEAAQKYADKNERVAVGASNDEVSTYIVGFLKSLSGKDKALASTELGVNAGITAEQLAGSRTSEQLLELQAKIDELAFGVDLAKAEQEAAILETDAQLLALQSQSELMVGARKSEDPEVVKRHNEALLSQAVSAGVAEEAIDGLRKAMEEKDKALARGGELTIKNAEANEEAARIALEGAMEYERMAEAMNGAATDFQGALDILNDDNMGIADKEIAMGNLATRMGEIVGIPLPQSFFESKEQLKLLQDAINGDDTAWYNLITNAWNTKEGMRIMAEQFGQAAEDIEGWARKIDAIQFGVKGTADVSEIVNEMATAVGSVEAAAKMMEMISGYKVTFKMETQSKKILTGFDTITESTGVGDSDLVRPSMGVGYNGNLIQPKAQNKLERQLNPNVRVKSIPRYSTIQVPGAITANLDKTVSAYSSPSGGGYSVPSAKNLGGYKSPSSNPKNAKAPAKGKSPSTAKDKAAKKDAEKEVEIWENGYDRLYNLVQKTNAEIRTRNKLERDYGRHLTDNSKTYKDMIKNVQAQRASLQSQQKMYQDQRSGRINELGIAQTEYSDVKKYASLNTTTGVIQIDWAAIDKNTDVDRGERIEAYISELERIAGELESITDSSEEIIDQLEALRELGKDSYLDLERRVYDALLAREQEQLDALIDLDETITKSSNTIASRISEAIAEERAARAEDKALQNIQEKERRLALLRSDTSGANQLDILALEEQLETDRENFTDSLIDKAITTMQKNADEASKQRQFQIEVAQAQYNHAVENGDYWKEARDTLAAHAAANTTFEGSPLSVLLGKYEDIKGMSTLGRSDWYDDTKRAVKEGFAWYELEGKEAEAKQKKIDDEAKAKAKAEADRKAAASAPKPPTSSPSTPPSEPKNPPPTVGGFVNAGSAKIWTYPNQSALGQYYGKDPKYRVLKEMGDWLQVRYHKLNSGVTGWFRKNDVKAYKTGGLADYTGPAWVDGTKKKPEAFLSAHDTQNFMTLRDLLSDALKGGAFAESTNSGSIFNIDVRVDSISNDYDVKEMVKIMKKELEQEARYRNVNSINIGMR